MKVRAKDTQDNFEERDEDIISISEQLQCIIVTETNQWNIVKTNYSLI